jgi:putative tryptophan/tyrosine transport system substrate-binding protein
MKRRAFLMLVGAVALVCGPCAAGAQPAKVPTVGVLVLGNPPPQAFLAALRSGLREIGYVEGRNIRLEVRSAEGRADRLDEKAAELLNIDPDILVAYQTPASLAAKKVTSDIPIVMSNVGDPIGTGLVASLARPGANITGTSAGTAEVAGKTVELIREMLPGARRVALLASPVDPFTRPYVAALLQGTTRTGLELEVIMARPDAPIEPAFDMFRSSGSDAMIVQGSMMRTPVVELAAKHRVALFSSLAQLPRTGGLAAYAVDFDAMLRETAGYVDKIVKGSRPLDLPVSFPTKLHLIVNQKTARALGVTVPPALLNRADEVIE